MRYWYRLSEVEMWEEAIKDGLDDPELPPLYEETPEIVRDFSEDPMSDWWPLRRRDSVGVKDDDAKFEFKTKKEAENDMVIDLSEALYCKIHDC